MISKNTIHELYSDLMERTAIRETVLSTDKHRYCAYCKSRGKKLKDGRYRLYRYGVRTDLGGDVLSPNLFCSRSCYYATYKRKNRIDNIK